MNLFKVDKEGIEIIRNTFIILASILLITYVVLPEIVTTVIGVLSLILWILVIRFFRLPHRKIITNQDTLFSPADGTIVVIEKTFEPEYFKDERIQVSIFMSIWNVHANWFGLGGKVTYFKHHNGKFMVAWHPKSSTENERTTIVVESENVTILFRQIAGLLAKRIVSYANVGSVVKQNERLGFIKFGSRVDVFLPLDAEIKVKMGDKVVGSQTEIAKIKR